MGPWESSGPGSEKAQICPRAPGRCSPSCPRTRECGLGRFLTTGERVRNQGCAGKPRRFRAGLQGLWEAVRWSRVGITALPASHVVLSSAPSVVRLPEQGRAHSWPSESGKRFLLLLIRGHLRHTQCSTQVGSFRGQTRPGIQVQSWRHTEVNHECRIPGA